MFDLIGLLILVVLVGGSGYVLWQVFKSDEVQESLDEAKDELDDALDALPTLDELKKLTKRELLELADKLGLDVDDKLTKLKIAEEIDNNRS